MSIDGISELGKRLVAELELSQSTDTLARWMAHRIAELIQAAKDAAPDARESAYDRCASAILDLWTHRHELPDGSRPFEKMEPVMRALRSLDPDEVPVRWKLEFPERLREGMTDEGAKGFLQLALDVDRTARAIIRQLVLEAVEAAKDRTKEWVSLATAAGVASSGDLFALRIILSDGKMTPERQQVEEKRKELSARRDRLNSWNHVIQGMIESLDSELQSLPGAE